MSCDYWLYSERTDTSVYIGYSWGCGINEETLTDEQRRAAAEWIAAHVGETVQIQLAEPRGREVCTVDDAQALL